MAATMVRKEAANVSGMETQMKTAVQFVKCECCGLTEECTEAYIARVRERNQGRWICGLCAEAVKDEMVRSSSERRIGRDKASNRHMTSKDFASESDGGIDISGEAVAVEELGFTAIKSGE